MKKLCVIIALFLTGVLLASSCAKKPHFIGAENISIEGIQGNDIVIRLDYLVFNLNKAKARLKNSDLAIYYRDSLIGKGTLEHPVALTPMDTLVLPIRCKLDLEQLSNHAATLLKDESVTFRLVGKNGINFALGDFEMKIKEDIEVDANALLESEIQKHMANGRHIRLRKVILKPRLDFRSTRFEALVSVENNLPFDYKIKHFDMDFYWEKDDLHLADWQLSDPVSVKSDRRISLNVDIKTDNVGLLKRLRPDRLLRKETDILMKGEVTLEIAGHTFLIPVEDRQSWRLQSFLNF